MAGKGETCAFQHFYGFSILFFVADFIFLKKKHTQTKVSKKHTQQIKTNEKEPTLWVNDNKKTVQLESSLLIKS